MMLGLVSLLVNTLVYNRFIRIMTNVKIDNNIRVTKEELDRMNRTSVQLADGSGEYLAAVDVYHHLHCLVGQTSLQF
jgi:hypothetical protein